MLHDTRNALRSKWFWLSAGLALAVLIQPVYDELFPFPWHKSTVDPLSIIASARAFGIIGPYAPVFAIVPYSASIVEEVRSGYMKYVLLRMHRRDYALQKMISASVSGAFALMIPFFILFFMAVLNGGLSDMVVCPDFYLYTVWENIFLNYGGLIVLTYKLLLVGLFGAIWALVGLVCACISNNRFITVVLPFVWYQASWMIFSESPYCPIHLLSADDIDLPSLSSVFVIDLSAILALLVISYCAMRWRCRHA